MEARSKSVEDWFSLIEQGEVLLPRFQRHEAWRTWQIEGVLENILRAPSLPIGALLTLEVGSEELFHSRPIVGAPKPVGGLPSMHLLDGQQRMTSLWRSLTDDYDELTVFVSLAESDEPDIEIVKRWDRKGIKQPVWADDSISTYDRNLAPVRLLRPGSKGETSLIEWTEQATDDRNDQRKIERYLGKLRQRIASYSIPFLSLPVTTEQEVALDVFIKMNTSATPLKDFDIVVAQVEGSLGQSLHDMVEDLCVEVSGARDFGKIEDIVLAVGALLQDKPPLKKTYLEPNYGASLASVWEDVKRGLELGLPFLRSEGIFDEKRLPTDAAVVLSCALWAKVPENAADIEGQARTLIRRALWCACLTDRYLKTQSTRTFADFKALAEAVATGGDGSQAELFNSELYPLPAVEELHRAGWPSKKDRLPRAILAASLRSGARDFADDANVNENNVVDREYHHIFPVHVLGMDRDDVEVSRALNCALITWVTNRKIAANTPKAYLEKRANAASMGEDEIRRRLETHLIPYDALAKNDYQKFLSDRAEMMHNYMSRLALGENI